MKKFIRLAGIAVIAFAPVLNSCPNVIDYDASQDNVMLYRITATPKPVNGQIKFSEESAPVGTYIKVYILPAPGYILREGNNPDMTPYFSYYCRGKTGGRKEPIGGSVDYFYRQFRLEAFNTEVSAEFILNPESGKYTVSADTAMRNGFIVPDVLNNTFGAAGTEVKLHIFPDPGYVLDKTSLVIKDASTGQSMQGIAIAADSLPCTFSLPEKNVIVSAEFKTADFDGYLSSAQNYIKSGQYDTAASYYAEAYKKRAGASVSDLNEVIFYNSLGKLGSILLDTKVRELLGTGKGHFQMAKVPVSMNDWICDSDSGWLGTSEDRWYMTYKGVDYGNNQWSEKGYVAEDDDMLKWSPSAVITDDIVLPRLELRIGIDRENNEGNRNGSFAGSFADMPLNNENVNSRQAFFNRLFWILLCQNRDQGFNKLLQNLEDRLFGAAFEDAAKLADSLPADAQVLLYPNLVNRFGLDEYYGSGNVIVGKAELNYIFGMLRLVKASVQYLSAYDWTIDLRPWLIRELRPEDGLSQIMDKAFKLVVQGEKVYREYWDSSSSRAGILPFRNRLLEIKTAGNIVAARNEFSRGLTMLNNAMVYWHGSSGNFISTAKTDYYWVKVAVENAVNAMSGGNNGNFGFPKKLPKPGEAWPVYASADYALNLPVFFTAGSFNLKKLFTTETGGVPSMFKIPWCYGDDYTDVELLPQQASRITAIFSNNDDWKFPGLVLPLGKNQPQFGLYSLELNTGHLRTIFPRGFEQNKYSASGEKAYFYEVFPTIPLWPERPTYLLGPTEGNKSAQYLYNYYHDLKITSDQQ